MIITWAALVKFTGYSEATIRYWLGYQGFPKPFRVKNGCANNVVWVRDEVLAWFEQREKKQEAA